MGTIISLTQLDYGNISHVQSHSFSMSMILISNIFTSTMLTISFIHWNNITNYLFIWKVNITAVSIFSGITTTIMLMSPCQITTHQYQRDFNVLWQNQHTLLINKFDHTINSDKKQFNQIHYLLCLLIIKQKFNKQLDAYYSMQELEIIQCLLHSTLQLNHKVIQRNR